MKLFISFIFSLFLVCFENALAGDIRVRGQVADSLCANNQEAYLFCQYENQAAIIDSCLIVDGRFDLTGPIPFDEVMVEVILDGVPASSGSMVVNQGEVVDLRFTPIGRYGRPKVTGARSAEELYSVLHNAANTHRMRLFRELRSLSPSDEKHAAVKDSIAYYSLQSQKDWEQLLRTTNSCFNAVYAYIHLESEISEPEQKEFKEYIKTKFPTNHNISMITHAMPSGEPVPATTPESKAAFNRYAEIIGAPLPHPELRVVSAPGYEKRMEAVQQPYGQGDVVADFTLPSIVKNQAVRLADISSEYVLIDFWASWCRPCRAESPYLKEALETYGDRLAILAVSIDSNLYLWRKAVEQDGTQRFVHAILRQDHPDCGTLRQAFGIKTIPHNFLLDKNRRIIAIDLRGEELEKKIAELTGTDRH